MKWIALCVAKLLPLLLLASGSWAQEEGGRLADSLHRLIQQHPQKDTTRALLLAKQSFYSYSIDASAGVREATEALTISDSLHWIKGAAIALQSRGACYWSLSNYKASVDDYLRSIQLYKALGMDNLVAQNLISLGAVSQAIGDISSAKAYYTNGADAFKKIKNYQGFIGALYDLSYAHMSLQQYDTAKSIIEYGIRNALEHHIPREFVSGKINLAELFVTSNQFNFGKALLDSLVNEKFGILEPYRAAFCNDMLSNLLTTQKDYKQALVYRTKAINLYKQIKHYGQINESHLQIGNLYYLLSKKTFTQPEREYYLKKAEKEIYQVIRNGRENTLHELENAYYVLQMVNEARGNFKQAYHYQSLSKQVSDSIFSKTNQREAVARSVGYVYQRSKDSLAFASQVTQLQLTTYFNKKLVEDYQKRQTILYFLIGAGILLTLMIILLYQRNLSNTQLNNKLTQQSLLQKIQEADFEHKMNELSSRALQTQMNPHFIFNCLNGIRLLIEQNDSSLASTYLIKFSRLIRLILESSSKEFVSITDEIDSLNLYLELEKLRFKEKLAFVMKLDLPNQHDIYLPPMLIQPFVENAIWHGLMPKPNGGNVSIQMKSDPINRILIVKVEDDGIGMKDSKSQKKENEARPSRGMSLTSDRLKLLGKKFKRSWSINHSNIEMDAMKSGGTLVTINIPYK
ncbi:MAG: histidine kinase [Bacteroidetes bacterium]|nr:histidine kinase [Bacteroidota bacterium]MBS1740886.1 histidine kinase [Bacteroidota bacterium]